MERVGSTRRHKGPEVPFGIRAIESGIEVDGVWISRSNTPVPSLPATPAPASPASAPSIAPRPNPLTQEDSPDRSSSASNISRLDIPQPVYGYPDVNLRYSGPSSGTLDSSFERLKPGANLPIPPGSDLPDLARVQQIRPTYQPRHSSQLRYSNSHDYDNNNVATAAAMESGGLPSDRETSQGEFTSSYACFWKTVRIASLTCMKPESGDPKMQRVRETSTGSADSEGPPSFERDELDSASEFSFRMASHDTFNQKTTVPDEPSFQTMRYQNPGSEQIPPAAPRIKSPGVNNEPSASTHLAEQNFYATKPQAPLHVSDDPFTTPTKNPEEMQQTRLHKGAENSDPSYSQYKRSDNDESSRADFNTRLFQAAEVNRPNSESQVIRKINSGFEILRPGTLNRPQTHDDTKLKGENNAEKQLSRKLQRKSRGVGHSRESRFVEET